jgi:hypothetical protein
VFEVALLEQRAVVIAHAVLAVSFEIDQLIRHVQQQNSAFYGKGVNVVRSDDGLLIVGELVVEHPGMEMVGAGLNEGWFYEVGTDGQWTRKKHPEECPCGNDYVHQRHMSALSIIEEWLEKPEEFSA